MEITCTATRNIIKLIASNCYNIIRTCIVSFKYTTITNMHFFNFRWRFTYNASVNNSSVLHIFWFLYWPADPTTLNHATYLTTYFKTIGILSSTSWSSNLLYSLYCPKRYFKTKHWLWRLLANRHTHYLSVILVIDTLPQSSLEDWPWSKSCNLWCTECQEWAHEMDPAWSHQVLAR